MNSYSHENYSHRLREPLSISELTIYYKSVQLPVTTTSSVTKRKVCSASAELDKVAKRIGLVVFVVIFVLFMNIKWFYYFDPLFITTRRRRDRSIKKYINILKLSECRAELI